MRKQSNVEEKELGNYSFCLFRLPENGGRALWEITNRCNYSCGYCIFSAEKNAIPGELTTEEVFSALDDLKSRDFTHIKFTGGEPFIRRDFVEILRKAKDLGFIVDVSTNGSLITADKAKHLIDLNMIHVSLDGHNQETHELARGKGTYNPTIRGIQNLVNAGVYLRLGAVIFKGNEDYLKELVDSAACLGADEIIFSFMEPVGRMKDDESIISKRPIPEVKKELEQLAGIYGSKIKVNYSFTEDTAQCEGGTCPGVKRFLYIDNLGRVSPCTWVVEKYPEFRSDLSVKTGLDHVLDSKQIKNYFDLIKGVWGCPVKRR